VPAAQLGSFGQLGWTTWLVSQPPAKDADDLVLQPRAA
jgi:predicted component of type VI protein secretion system